VVQVSVGHDGLQLPGSIEVHMAGLESPQHEVEGASRQPVAAAVADHDPPAGGEDGAIIAGERSTPAARSSSGASISSKPLAAMSRMTYGRRTAGDGKEAVIVDRAKTAMVGIPCIRRFTAAGLLALGLLALAVPDASASIETASHSLDINPGGTRSPAATCAPGTVPVSPGFSVAGFTPVKGGIVPFASQRTAGGSSATGRNVSPSVTGTLTDYAYCDTDPRTIVTRSSQAGLPVNHARTVSASCPAGTTLLSGGYKVTNGPHASGAAFRSRKVAGGWTAAAYNGGPGQSTLRVFAYCQRNGPQLQTRAATATIPMQKMGSAQAKCPAGTRPVAGGFDGHLVISPSPTGALPITSVRTAGGWRITGFSVSEGPSAQLSVFAYCEPL
jgi:hypothetical protein